MKKGLLAVLAVLLLAPLSASASGFDLNLNLDLGHHAAAPAIEEPPLFLVPPALGFRVAVGVNYEMVMIDGGYFSFHAGSWHRAPGYDGPWVVVAPASLPPGLRKHGPETIVRLRDEEYHLYQKDKNRYQGKSYRPEKRRDGERKEKKEKGKKEKGRHD